MGRNHLTMGAFAFNMEVKLLGIVKNSGPDMIEKVYQYLLHREKGRYEEINVLKAQKNANKVSCFLIMMTHR